LFEFEFVLCRTAVVSLLGEVESSLHLFQ